ncbi:MAG: acyl-CoA thioesterase [Planctomycetota bacterium]|jgi:acyl-CoA thioester hydrolase
MSELVPCQAVGRIEIRVRYSECDAMRVAHHTAYPVWFEMGRTELLRESGLRYRDLEEQGVFFAVTALAVRYKRPALYDDLLALETKLTSTRRAKIEHAYEISRGRELLATGSTTLVCLGADGRPRPLPEPLRVDSP